MTCLVSSKEEAQPNVADVVSEFGRQSSEQWFAGDPRTAPSDDHQGTPLVEPFPMMCASAVPYKQLEWVWHPHFLVGYPTLWTGKTKVGKTTLLSAVIACHSRGDRLPEVAAMPTNLMRDGRRQHVDAMRSGVPFRWGYFTTEDGAAEMKVRLEAAGANMDEVFLLNVEEIGTGITLDSTGKARLAATIKSYNLQGVVFDPLLQFTPDSVKENRAKDVRKFFEGVVSVTRPLRVVFVGVMHLRKGQAGGGNFDAIEAISGSHAWSTVARGISVVVADDEEDDEGRTKAVLYSAGSNFGRKVHEGLAFSIGDDGLRFDGTETRTVQEMADQESGGALADAQEFILAEMSASPEGVASSEMFKKSRANGISDSTLKRAKKLLGVQAHKGSGGTWSWVP